MSTASDRRYLGRFAGTALLVLALSGCNQAGQPSSSPSPDASASAERVSVKSIADDGVDAYSEISYKLSDGRTVTCLQVHHVKININQGSSGGISCDWAAAK